MGDRMKRWTGPILGAALTGLLTIVVLGQTRSSEVLWRDFDMKNIPEPKERQSGYYDYFFKGQFVEEGKRELDVPRWARLAVGKPKQAANVNALDEVPDSSWYTNRQRFHRMSAAELQRGPNRGSAPDFSQAVVTKAKTAGVTPGLMLKDATGQAYLIKFDNVNYPNLQSGAEVISTKIFYAAGYNVPENYIAYLDPKNLTIDGKAEFTDANTGKKRPLTRDDIDELLQRVARMPDGRCRVMASKVLAGKPKGPFPQVGFRNDDPNDLIPHEHRRELRGLRVIASWINDWDLKEAQSLDMYVEEGGRKFLRHYLLDFGASLGADDKPMEYFHGHEYGFDLHSIAKEIFSLGLYESENEKTARIITPEIGNFSSDFEPGNWKQTFPSVMFDNLTDLDAFWATRVILSLSDDDLRSIVETAEFTDPYTGQYIVRTLGERRSLLAKYWLRKVDALSDFSVASTAEGVRLGFHDLMVDQRLADAKSTAYSYEVKGPHYKSGKKNISGPEIRLDRETLASAVERNAGGSPIEVSIWAHRDDFTSDPVRVYFDWSPGRDTLTIRRIVRG
jgi:hypothetical protein